jgi:hypothetical protein
MAKADDTLDTDALGFWVPLKRTAAETAGEELEVQVTGRRAGPSPKSTCTSPSSSAMRCSRAP